MRIITGLVLLVACGLVPADEPNQRQLLNAVEKQLKDTATTAGPSIATIVVSRSERYPKVAGKVEVPGKLGGFDVLEFLKAETKPSRAELARFLDLSSVRGIPDHGYAGGVVIDAVGYVLTPYHVIEGATKIYVFLPGGLGSYADIHAADARADLAVLKLITPPPKLQAIKYADVRTIPIGDKPRTMFTGKLCVLMTNAYSATFGLDQPTAGFGSITNVRYRPLEKSKSLAPRSTEYSTMLEYDIKPNASMTGGVLLNLDSEMIGLTNAAAVAWGNEIGPGYAVPVDAIFRRIVDELRKGQEVEYGFLGVSPSNDTGPGVLIETVSFPGPAQRAGILGGDRVTAVDGHPIDNFYDLLHHIGGALAGSRVRVTLFRGGRQRDIDVTLTKFSHALPSIASVRPDVFGLRVDYRDSVIPRSSPDATSWVCIREVVPDSPAAAKFKPLGDPKRFLITHVNGTEVSNPAEFYQAAKGQEKVKLTLLDSLEVNPRPKELTLP